MRPAKQGADPRRKPASSRQFTSQIPESYFFRGLSSWAIQSPAAAVSIYDSCRAPVYRTTSTQNRSKPAAQPASPSNKRPRPTSCEKSKIRSPFNEKKNPGSACVATRRPAGEPASGERDNWEARCAASSRLCSQHISALLSGKAGDSGAAGCARKLRSQMRRWSRAAALRTPRRLPHS